MLHRPPPVRVGGGLLIARAGVRVPDEASVVAWRREFDAGHAIRIPGVLEPALLGWIRSRLEAARFTRRVHPDVDPPAVDVVLDDSALNLTIALLLNDTRLFEVVRRITECASIGSFHGIVYALDSTPDMSDSWHSDLDGNRLAAMSINVGGAYDGGVLQIRDARSTRVLTDLHNPVAGDGVLFRIRGDLEHRVTPVTGSSRRIVLAGWFQREPAALERLRAADGIW